MANKQVRRFQLLSRAGQGLLVTLTGALIAGVMMKLISENDINSAVSKMGTYGTDPMGTLFELMCEEQEELFQYLMEADSDYFNQDERDLLVTILIMAWFILKEAMGSIPPKSGEFIDYHLGRNFNLFDELCEDEDADEVFFDKLMSGEAGQPMLMSFLSSLLLDRPEEYSGEILEEHIPAMILHIKTAVDALVLDEEEWLFGEDVGEYSDKALEESSMAVAKLYDEFEKSAFFKALKEDERKDARMIITMFGELMYEYFLLTPEKWTAWRAMEICEEIMPGKIDAPQDFFPVMYPVMISFLEFSEQKGAVPGAGRIALRLANMNKER